MSRKRSVEYVGKKFGKLFVVSEADKRNGKRMFLCKCDCGNESIVRGTHLTSGRVQSCGCVGRIDIAGQRYGRLVAIEFDRVENGRTYWKCRCDCGNIVSVNTGKLRDGHTQSCGCLAQEAIRRQRKHNEYEVVGGYVKVKLNDNDYMLCDIEDWEKLKCHSWFVNPNGYATSGTSKGAFMFHKKVTNTTSEIVDHINRNKLDNRKCNLRVCDMKINSINRDLQSNNTTGYKGVYYNKRDKTWNARVTVDGKTIHLGTFLTKEEAIAARQAGEEKYYLPQFESVTGYI